MSNYHRSNRARMRYCLSPVLGLALLVTSTATAVAADVGSAGKCVFTAAENGAYAFDTGALRGTLRRDGKSFGLSSVVHVPSGARLDGGTGILGFYRIFTTNARYGTAAWEWPSESELLSDGAVQVTWPAADDRPFEITAVYRWADPLTLDVTTTVEATKDLSKFEAFLASYFDESLASPYVCVAGDSQASGDFLLATKQQGAWQMFPRDKKSEPMIRDGRWEKPPHPVDWVIMPRMAKPVGLRRSASGLAAILMAPRRDCFTIATPYEGESHYSMYLSLLGRDVKVGETAQARSRLVIAMNASNEQIHSLYEAYVKHLRTQNRKGRRSR